MEQINVEWIGIRPARRTALIALQEVLAVAGAGLSGDHYASPGGKRQVTLIRAEDLERVATDLGAREISPFLTRRNLVLRGLPDHLPAGRRLLVGECLMEISGPCHPCSRMDENLGPGGLKSMAGMGGFTARILQGGTIRLADEVYIA